MQRFAVDGAPAQRVAQTACTLFAQVAEPSDGPAQRQLAWAGQLHEVGCRISHSDYHRHGAYILDHTNAAGFAMAEMHRLGRLVLGHRGKLRKIEAELNDVPGALAPLMLASSSKRALSSTTAITS